MFFNYYVTINLACVHNNTSIRALSKTHYLNLPYLRLTLRVICRIVGTATLKKTDGANDFCPCTLIEHLNNFSIICSDYLRFDDYFRYKKLLDIPLKGTNTLIPKEKTENLLLSGIIIVLNKDKQDDFLADIPFPGLSIKQKILDTITNKTDTTKIAEAKKIYSKARTRTSMWNLSGGEGLLLILHEFKIKAHI